METMNQKPTPKKRSKATSEEIFGSAVMALSAFPGMAGFGIGIIANALLGGGLLPLGISTTVLSGLGCAYFLPRIWKLDRSIRSHEGPSGGRTDLSGIVWVSLLTGVLFASALDSPEILGDRWKWGFFSSLGLMVLAFRSKEIIETWEGATKKNGPTSPADPSVRPEV